MSSRCSSPPEARASSARPAERRDRPGHLDPRPLERLAVLGGDQPRRPPRRARPAGRVTCVERLGPHVRGRAADRLGRGRRRLPRRPPRPARAWPRRPRRTGTPSYGCRTSSRSPADDASTCGRRPSSRSRRSHPRHSHSDSSFGSIVSRMTDSRTAAVHDCLRRSQPPPGTPPRHRDPRAALHRAVRPARQPSWPAGVGTTLPVFVDRAGGGVIVDVDGNSLIDFGSGIAVASVGNAADAVVAPGAGAGRAVHPHLLHGHAVRGVRRGLRGARPADARRPREALGAVQLRRRGGGERREDRPRAHRAAGRRRVRPRLPRPHQPHDGADRQEHALQALVRPVRARGLPGADVLPVPRPGGHDRRAGRGRARSTSSRSRSAPTTSRACVIEPIQGEGGFVVPAPGFLPALAAWCTDNGVVFVADEIQTGFCRTGDWFACDARGRRARPGHARPRASPAACRWPRSPAAPRSWTRRTSAGSAAPTAATRSPAPRRSARSRRWRRRTSCGARAADRRGDDRRGCASWPRRYDVIGDVRGRGAMVAIELDPARHPRAGRRRDGRGREGLPRRGSGRAHLRHLRQRAAVPAAARDARATCSTRGSASSRRRSRVGWPESWRTPTPSSSAAGSSVDGELTARRGGRVRRTDRAGRHRRRGPRDRRAAHRGRRPVAGGLVLPGFQDAHAHPLAAGVDMLRCDLNDAASAEDTLARIRGLRRRRTRTCRGSSGPAGRWATSPAACPTPRAARRGRPGPARAAAATATGTAPGPTAAPWSWPASTPRPRTRADGRIERDADGQPAGHPARGRRRAGRAHARRCPPPTSSWPGCSRRRRCMFSRRHHRLAGRRRRRAVRAARLAAASTSRRSASGRCAPASSARCGGTATAAPSRSPNWSARRAEAAGRRLPRHLGQDHAGRRRRELHRRAAVAVPRRLRRPRPATAASASSTRWRCGST